MNSRTWLVVTVAIICIIAVCSVFYMKTAGTGFFPSPSDGAGNGTPDSVNATTRPVTGRPCTVLVNLTFPTPITASV